jgi:hypothetical protein
MKAKGHPPEETKVFNVFTGIRLTEWTDGQPCSNNFNELDLYEKSD